MSTTIHAALDAERQAQGLSYAEVARRGGLKPSTAYDILTGRRPDPQASTLGALLAALGVTWGWLDRRHVPAEPLPEKSPV